jgi:hyperosmotically inducible periplasmic protein
MTKAIREDDAMKTRKNILNAALTAAFLVMAGAGVNNALAAPSTAKPLTEQVRHQLVRLPWYGVFDNLEYKVVNGDTVVLSGQVVNDVTKNDAERAVKHIEGVARVINDIKVLPSTPFDDQTRLAVFRAIYRKAPLNRYSAGVIPSIHIIVDHGHVTLEGVVSTSGDRSVAGIFANQVPGVFSVTNNLRIG